MQAPTYPPSMAALVATATGQTLPPERTSAVEAEDAVRELAPMMATIRAVATGTTTPQRTGAGLPEEEPR